MIVLSKCPLLANTTLCKEFLFHYKYIKISIIKFALCIVVLLSELPTIYIFIYIIGFYLYHEMYYAYIEIINVVYSIVKVK